MSDTIVNRVAQSGILTLNLENFYPQEEIVTFDIKGYLYMELMLKEKDFRTSLKALDWSTYQNKHVVITCTTDAIVPYMGVYAYRQLFRTLCSKCGLWRCSIDENYLISQSLGIY